jgi:hypothetical protein
MCKKLIFLSCFTIVFGLLLTNATEAADPNLVGWWKFNGNTNDASGNGLNGIPFGDPNYLAGPTYGANLPLYPDNLAINLLGVVDAQPSAEQYVDLPIGNVISELTDCTFSLWVNYRQPHGGNRWQRIFDFGTATNNYVALLPRRSSSAPTHFEINANGTVQRVSYGPYSGAGTVIPRFTWVHIAVTIDDVNNIFRMYVNGEQVGETTGTAATLAPIDLGVTTMNYVGRTIDPGSQGPYFPGYLDDFRIYNRTLSLSDVRQSMGYPIASFPTPADDTVFPEGTTTVNLTWAKGANAAEVNGSHLYLGNNRDEVDSGNAAVDKGLITGSSYTAIDLAQDIYYWRVDTVNADGTIHKGDIWSFRIQPRIAWSPTPADGALHVAPKATLQWRAGTGAVQGHNVYLSDNFDQVDNAAIGSTAAPFRTFIAPTTGDPSWTPAKSAVTLSANKTYYWRVDEIESSTAIHKGQVWSFTTVPSSSPVTDPNLVGWWKLDYDVIDSAFGCDGTAFGDPMYDVGYFGSSIYLDNASDSELDNDVYVSLPNGSVISTLTNSTLAIWVNWIGTETSRVNQRFFSFSTEPANSMYLAPRTSVSAPTHFQISSGGVTQTVGYGSNTANTGTIIPTNEWHHLAVTINADSDVFTLYFDGQQAGELTDANLTPSDLGVTTNNWLGRSEDAIQQRPYRGYLDDFRIYNKVLSSDEVKQLLIRLTSNVISPRHRAENTTDMPTLIWEAGDRAAQHDVYLGTDQTAVTEATTATAGIYRGRQALNDTSYVPTENPLTWGQTYYWRIDEIEANGTLHVGNVWNFIVADFVVADDFEAYNDTDNQIYLTWEDYYVNNTGMTVGHFDAPFAERTIIHGGRQAMYMRYDNDGTVNEGTSYEQGGTMLYSETQRTYQTPQDWTKNGANTLSLWFRGLLPSFGSFTAGQQTYTLTARGAGITGTSDQFFFAYQRLNGLGSITAKVVSMTNTATAAKAGVMIRETLEPGSANVMVAVQPTAGIVYQDRPSTDDALATVATVAGSAPYWVRVTRNGNTFTGEYSADGVNWVDMGTATVLMQMDTYVGLCLTSGTATATCTAEFSNVSTTGTVTGPWQSQDIGIASNTAEQLYIVLEDNAANSATVKYPDFSATITDVYTQWTIPIADFAGVNPRAVKKMVIGIGDRNNPQAGGSGDMYIDDIGIYPPPLE